ncbi:MAG: T9SS type A sorting domain-containing protein, partial [Bacteroidales bacterium]|nr:T9SS type A sorting domain-containing protein [Bacteroidales bacterium]
VVSNPTGSYQYNIDGGTYQSSTTFAGVSPGSHTILVRRTSDNTCISSPTIVTVSTPSAPTAATASVTVQPTCAVATGTVVVSAPTGAYEYKIDGGTYQSSVTFTGVNPGSHTILVRRSNDISCISLPTTVTVNAQPSAPQAATAGITVQPTCAAPTATIVVSNPTGSYQYNIDGGTYQSSTTFTGVSPGSHTILVRRTSDNTCISDPTTVTVSTPSAPQAASASVTVQPTCATPTATIVVSNPTGSYQYNIDGGTYQSSTTFAGVSPGSHTILVRSTSDNTCISSPTIVNVSTPSAPSAATASVTVQPTCAVSTGTVVVSAPTGAYEYNIDGGTYQSSVTFTGISSGLHTILVRRTTDNTCISSPTTVTVNAQPTTPSAPLVGAITQPDCSVATGSVVLSGLPSSGTWTLTRTPGGTTYSSTGTSYTASGIPPGTYTFIVTNAAGCMSGSSANVVINANPTAPSAPTVGTITQPTCTEATASVVLGGLPSTGSWTLTRSPGGNTYSSTGTSYTVTGLTAGTTYSFTITGGASGCTSEPSANVVINPQPSTPTAPTVGTITQPTCTESTASVLLGGLPSSGTWTLTRTPGGNTYSSTGTSYTVTGLAAATTFTFVVTNASGCTSGASANVVVNSQPATPSAPLVGTITQPTCIEATGSVMLNGLPSTGTWIITRSPGGNTYSSTGTSYTISGLEAGTYTFVVSNASGCTSLSSANAVIETQPYTSAPIVGTIIQPTCTEPTGSVTLNGLPSSGTWTLTRSPGGTTYSSTGTSYTVTGLAAGTTYTFDVTGGPSACTSSSSEIVVIHNQPETPSAPVVGTITQPTCAVATGSVLISGLPSSGTWTLTQTPGGTTYSSSGTSYTVSELVAGTYTFIVTNESGCTSGSSANVVVDANPATPSAPTVGTIIQPTCDEATGSVELSGLPSGDWIINPGDIDGSGASTTITDLVAGTYNFTVTNDAGCISTISADVVINAQPATPTAPTVGTVIQPTCEEATGSVELVDLPFGDWTINPGDLDGSGSSTTISDLVTGTYNYTVTNEDGCTSAASADVVIDVQPAMPSAPTVGTITQPTCLEATGSVELGDLPSGDWTINPGTISGSGAGTTISDLATGTYNFTVTNEDGCISTVSADVVIDAQPTTPPKPDIELLNDNLLRSDAMAGNQWYEEVTGIIDGATDQDYTVLVTGDYFTIVTNDEGCSSEPSDTLHVVILGISQPALSKLIKLYPNPTDGKVRLSIAAQETHKIDVVVMDILGQTLNIDKVELPNNQIELNLKDLSGGSYLIKITYSGNTVIEKVILKK